MKEIPPSQTLADLDEAFLSSTDFVSSSFAYRISAVRNLGRVLMFSRAEILDTAQLDIVDVSLVNWNLELPTVKAQLSGRDGPVDEMLFQAHMIANL